MVLSRVIVILIEFTIEISRLAINAAVVKGRKESKMGKKIENEYWTLISIYFVLIEDRVGDNNMIILSIFSEISTYTLNVLVKCNFKQFFKSLTK